MAKNEPLVESRKRLTDDSDKMFLNLWCMLMKINVI